MNKYLALLLSVLIVFAMAGCTEEPAPSTDPSTEAPTVQTTLPEETTLPETEPTEPVNPKFDPELCKEVFGTWGIEVVLDTKLMVMPDFDFSTSFHVSWDLREDGTYTACPDPEVYKTNVKAFDEKVIEYMVDSRYHMFVAEKKIQGMKEAKIEEDWTAEEPKVRDEVTATVEGLAFGKAYANLDREGHYYVEDGSIYLSRPDGGYDSFTYLLGQTTLTFNDSNNIAYYENAGFQFPLILYRLTETEAE